MHFPIYAIPTNGQRDFTGVTVYRLCVRIYMSEIFHVTDRCENVTRWPIENIYQNIICKEKMKHDAVPKENIDEKCKHYDSCFKKKYSALWSHALWPIEHIMKSFVNHFLQRIFEARKKAYPSVMAWKSLIEANESEIPKILKENVKKVVISPKATHSKFIHKSRTYPFRNLLSDIGGILGLYLGMSILSVCELLQVLLSFFRFLRRRCDSHKGIKTSIKFGKMNFFGHKQIVDVVWMSLQIHVSSVSRPRISCLFSPELNVGRKFHSLSNEIEAKFFMFLEFLELFMKIENRMTVY